MSKATVNKVDLARHIAAHNNITVVEATEAIDRVTNAITALVTEGNSVTIRNFGCFKSRTRGERKGRNPRTSETIVIKERRVPAFTPGKGFKQEVAL